MLNHTSSHSFFNIISSISLFVKMSPNSRVIIHISGKLPSVEKPAGPYPTVVTQNGGAKVLVVQDFTFAKYLGHLKVTFNQAGDVISWDGNPILLDASVPKGTL